MAILVFLSISDRNISLFIKICRMFEKDSIKFIFLTGMTLVVMETSKAA